MKGKKLILAFDMYGCPNRCLHCWIGHMPNVKPEDGADDFVASYFYPYFEKIEFYSWLREPDFCPDYRQRWEKDKALSKNAEPERFELASFYRIVRDDGYIPFLRSVGVKKVQLSFFGLKETQDRYVGRSGAYEEIMLATEKLINGGIIPRWQCFINEENREEITAVYGKAERIRENGCKELEFFVHEGSCEGENEKLYPIRIEKDHIPPALLPVYLDYDKLKTERECCLILENDRTSPEFPTGGEITLYVSNKYDVYYNFTNMKKPWIIGNMKEDKPERLTDKIINGDTYALNKARECSWSELVRKYGDYSSGKAFGEGDYKTYLFNRYLNDMQI